MENKVSPLIRVNGLSYDNLSKVINVFVPRDFYRLQLCRITKVQTWNCAEENHVCGQFLLGFIYLCNMVTKM
jgi:hypothetical protein